jgi:hypothetical protein
VAVEVEAVVLQVKLVDQEEVVVTLMEQVVLVLPIKVLLEELQVVVGQVLVVEQVKQEILMVMDTVEMD